MATDTFVQELLESLKIFFRALPHYFRRDFTWWPVVIPVFVAAFVYLLSDADILGWRAGPENKDLMEIVHPALLGFGVLLSLGAWRLSGDRALALMAGICSVCLGRELGGQGTSVILVAGLFVCIWYANTHHTEIETFLLSSWTKSLVALCFVSYAGSQLLDRGVIKQFGRLLTGNWEWKPRYSSNMEECLEALGGFFLVLAAITLMTVALRRARADP